MSPYLSFEPVPELPRLSWCAKVTANQDAVRVQHGPWVETRGTSFTAGVWNGDFETEDFDRATSFLGSGARLDSRGVMFVAPTDPFFHLYTIRLGETLWVSNSLAFLLVRSGQEPDIHYAHYYHDLLHPRRWGITRRQHWLPLAGGRRAGLHLYCNLLVRPDLSMERIEKASPAAFEEFEEFRDQMVATMQQVFANACDPSRKQTFRPLTTISRGYDSPAVSALAAQAGCRDAVTLRSGAERHFFGDDDGSEIGERLGLSVRAFDMGDATRLRPLQEAEFAASTPSPGSQIGLYEDLLPGRILLTGVNGDYLWNKKDLYHQPALRMPTDNAAGSTALIEFSLRVGFIHFPATFITGVYSETLARITRSPSMKPWSVGGAYDRPIARRLVEERSVSRESFGRQKQGGGHIILTLDTMHPASRADFVDFLRERGLKAESRNPPFTMKDWLRIPFAVLYAILIRLPSTRLTRRLVPLALLGDRRMFDPRRTDPVFRYSFQWGFDRIRHRYEC